MNRFLEKLTGSIVGKGFGAAIREIEVGSSIKYLLIIMLVIGSIVMIKPEIELYTFSKVAVVQLKDKFPDFKLQDGKFICQGKMPYIYNGKESEVFIIDTSGKTNRDILSAYKSGVLITESTVEYKKNSVESRSYNLSDFRKFDLTKGRLIELIKTYTIPGLVVVFLLGLLFIFIGKMIGVLVLSIIALILAKILKTEADYQHLFKYSIFAIVLPTLIDYALDVVSIKIPYFWIIYYAVAIFYLVRYIRVVNMLSDNQEKDPDSETTEMKYTVDNSPE
jgi:hypothetical protein